MTIDKAIERVDERKPNALDDAMKAAWLIELDGRVWAEIILRHEPDWPEDDSPACPRAYPEDGSLPLLVPAPYDNLYELYLEAMIDYYNREMALYQNSYAMFNEAYGSFARFYTRTHMPSGISHPILP